WALAIVFVTTFRAVARSRARRSASYVQNAVVVGAGDVGQLIARKLFQHREYGIDVVGFVDSDPKTLRDDLAGVAVLGSPSELAAIIEEHGVERVVVAFSEDSHEET